MERAATFKCSVRFHTASLTTPYSANAPIPAVHKGLVHRVRQNSATSIATASGASA